MIAGFHREPGGCGFRTPEGVTDDAIDAKIPCMRWGITLAVLTACAGAATAAAPSRDPLRWLEIIRTGEQPVTELAPERALVAAEVARLSGEPGERRRALERAVSGGPVAEVARVELAQMLADEQPAQAVDLILPTLADPGSRQLRTAAVEVAVAAVEAGLDLQRRRAIGGELGRLPRSERRALEAVLHVAAAESGRPELVRLLRRSQRDLPALQAARALLVAPEAASEVWLAAQSLYRHGLYAEAAPILERLAVVEVESVPAWEAAFLRGRCAFRTGRFQEAAGWYRSALARVARTEDRADLWVHLARALELDGNLEAAVEAARRSVLTRASDDRRLFLARLRLRSGREDLALRGIAGVRSRRSAARGWLLVGLARIARGQTDAALGALARVDRTPWLGPARVLAADLESGAGRPEKALRFLEKAAPHLDMYWAQQARAVMATLPPEMIGSWREDQRRQLEGTRRSRSVLARWGVLEIDAAALHEIRTHPDLSEPYRLDGADPPTPSGLAGQLWSLGLRDAAVRWDPGGFPRGTAGETLWTARRYLDAGMAAWSIRAADGAWRQAGSDLPVRLQPRELREALYPLPWRAELARAVDGVAVPRLLVAAIAREESRWDPSVLSVVGARGLMQLMPGTAADAARQLGRTPPRPDELFGPNLSLQLGAVALGNLLEAFDGRLAVVISAYNAGPAQAGLWMTQWGAELDEKGYVAGLTFSSTRSYTAEVLAGMRFLEERTRMEVTAQAAAAPGRTG